MPCLLCAAGLAALVLPGCRKGAEEPAEPVAQRVAKARPADPLTAALVSRDELAARLHAILEKAQDRLPNAGEAALKAELEKDAEWVRQKKEFDELTKTIDALRASQSSGRELSSGAATVRSAQVQGKISK